MSNHGVLKCFCGKKFCHENAFGKHQRSCVRTRKRLSGALGVAREMFAQKKQKVVYGPLASMSTADASVLEFPAQIEVSVIAFFSVIFNSQLCGSS